MLIWSSGFLEVYALPVLLISHIPSFFNAWVGDKTTSSRKFWERNKPPIEDNGEWARKTEFGNEIHEQ